MALFFNTLLSVPPMESSSSRVNWLELSIGQDLVYAISNGRIKTPKSILYPYAVKSLTNSTKLITINNQLGHGISASILEGLATENAFRVLENQLEDSVLLPSVSNEVFTMTVHDNIDRNEETLSGKSQTQFRFQMQDFFLQRFTKLRVTSHELRVVDLSHELTQICEIRVTNL